MNVTVTSICYSWVDTPWKINMDTRWFNVTFLCPSWRSPRTFKKRSQKTSRIARHLIFSSSCQGSHTEKTKHLWSFYCQGSPFRKNFLFQKPSKFGKRTEMELRLTRPISKHEKLLGIHIFAWKKCQVYTDFLGFQMDWNAWLSFWWNFRGFSRVTWNGLPMFQWWRFFFSKASVDGINPAITSWDV